VQLIKPLTGDSIKPSQGVVCLVVVGCNEMRLDGMCL
jgi:hypothetical protein